MFRDFGTPAQQAEFIPGLADGSRAVPFGLTEPDHGSDATHMETTAIPQTRDGVEGWLIDGEKMWTTGMHVATHCPVFARPYGKAGDAKAISCLPVPAAPPAAHVRTERRPV